MAHERGWYTSVYAAILDSPEYQRLSIEGASVWWALKLCPENNQTGIFPFFKDQVTMRSKIRPDQLAAAISELEDENWIKTAERWVWLRNHLKFDPNFTPENDKHVLGLVRKVNALPKIPLTAAFVRYYKKMGYLPIGYAVAMGRPPHTPSIPLSVTETNADTEAETNAITLVFEHWQTVMDHPDFKLSSERRACIRARLRDGYTTQQLMDAIDGCKASPFHRGQNDSRKVYDAITLIFRNAEKVDFFRAKNLDPVRNVSAKAQAKDARDIAMIQAGMEGPFERSGMGQGHVGIDGPSEPRRDTGAGQNPRLGLPERAGGSE